MSLVAVTLIFVYFVLQPLDFVFHCINFLPQLVCPHVVLIKEHISIDNFVETEIVIALYHSTKTLVIGDSAQ